MNVFDCPSDPHVLLVNSGGGVTDVKGDYGVNWGQIVYADQGLPAPFALNYGATIAEITDGTSQTLLLIEVIQTSHPPGQGVSVIGRRGRVWSDQPSSHQVSTRLTPNSPLPDNRACWPEPKAPSNRNTGDSDNHYIAARSMHPGGVNTLLADGSVRFIQDLVNGTAGRALSTRSGGEVSSSDAY